MKLYLSRIDTVSKADLIRTHIHTHTNKSSSIFLTFTFMTPLNDSTPYRYMHRRTHTHTYTPLRQASLTIYELAVRIGQMAHLIGTNKKNTNEKQTINKENIQ